MPRPNLKVLKYRHKSETVIVRFHVKVFNNFTKTEHYDTLSAEVRTENDLKEIEKDKKFVKWR
jgi:hypothetical protein